MAPGLHRLLQVKSAYPRPTHVRIWSYRDSGTAVLYLIFLADTTRML